MKSIAVLFAACAALVLSSCASHEKSYTNPLKTSEGNYIPVADPFVYGHDGVYYMTGSTALDEGFDYYTSDDMVTWKFMGSLFRPSKGHYGTSHFWAPEVKYYKGKFYLAYSSMDPESGLLLSALAVSDTPGGPFRELYAPWFNLGHSAIDCHIFVDDDETPYLYFSKNGVVNGVPFGENYAVQLSEDLSEFVGEPVLVGKVSQDWEKFDNVCNEGVFVIKKDGVYHMTYSANDTSYSRYGTGTAKAAHPLGPWVKDPENPILASDESKDVSGPGHASMVKSPGGDLYLVYHTHRTYNVPKPSWDRVVNIDKVYFDEKGGLRVKGPTRTPQVIR